MGLQGTKMQLKKRGALDMSPIKRSDLTSGVGMAAKLSKICDGIKTES